MTTRAATLRRGPAPRAPRRVSGPAHPSTRRAPAAAPARRKQSTDSFAALGRMALRVPDARVLDRLIRGRLWIGLIAGALVTLVFMQVSLLKLNTGISADLISSQNLERQNAELRAGVSSLDSGQRIQDIAAARGMVMPDDGQLRFLDAGHPGDGARAAQAMTAPDPQAAAQRAQAILLQRQQQQQQAAAAAAAATAQTQTPATATTTQTSTAPVAAPATTQQAPPQTTAPPQSTASPPQQQQQAAAPTMGGGQAAPTGQQ
jgi:hypothetical protein